MEVLDCVLIAVPIVCHFVCRLIQRHLRIPCFILYFIKKMILRTENYL